MEFKKLRGHYTNIKDLQEGQAMTSYLMARDGLVYENRVNEIGIFSTKAKEVYDLPVWGEFFKFALPEIPGELLSQISTFFKYFCNLDIPQEVMIQIYWDSEKQTYFLNVPRQRVTTILVDARYDEADLRLNKEYLLVADFHSHNTMGAFFSSRDDNDEKGVRLYGVIGRLRTEPEMKLRASCAGKYIPVEGTTIFTDIDLNREVEFPKEWLSKVYF